MKRFAFLVLVFATTFAEESIKEWAESFEAKEADIHTCLKEAETTEVEMQAAIVHFEKIEGGIIDVETKKILEKPSRFIACVLKKEEMMDDSKLILDKIMVAIEKEKENYMINTEFVKGCLKTLNDDGAMTREDRALGMITCLYAGYEGKKE